MNVIVKNDAVLRNAVKLLAIVRKMKKNIAGNINKYVKDNYDKENSKELLRQILEYAGEAVKQISDDNLLSMYKGILYPYLTGAEPLASKANNIELIRRFHERRKQLIYVGLNTGEKPVGFIKRGDYLALKGEHTKVCGLIRYIIDRASTYIKPHSNKPQHVVQFIISSAPKKITAGKIITQIPLEKWQNSLNDSFNGELAFYKFMSQYIKKHKDIPDVLVLDSVKCWGINNPLPRIMTWAKKHAAIVIANTDCKSRLSNIQFHKLKHDRKQKLAYLETDKGNLEIPSEIVLPK